MKPYKNKYKYNWMCPVCGEIKHSGGQGHIRAQACGHMRNKHPIECLETDEEGRQSYNMDKFTLPGIKLFASASVVKP